MPQQNEHDPKEITAPRCANTPSFSSKPGHMPCPSWTHPMSPCGQNETFMSSHSASTIRSAQLSAQGGGGTRMPAVTCMPPTSLAKARRALQHCSRVSEHVYHILCTAWMEALRPRSDSQLLCTAICVPGKTGTWRSSTHQYTGPLRVFMEGVCARIPQYLEAVQRAIMGCIG
eukprot:1139245-Pelagomonas_calceolata.AAC.4